MAASLLRRCSANRSKATVLVAQVLAAMLTRFVLRPGALGRPAPLRSCLCRGLAAAASGRDDGAASGRRWAKAPVKLVKRKVAIVSGYKGTGYHGLQLNDNVETIEDEIRRAIFQAGAMRESNFEDLGKIDWARSSRTDKGVHASCIVFSGKLLIDEENKVDPVSGRVRGLAEALNASLPDNIRVFSCTRVNKRFSARKNCVLREYEYFMPLSFLKDSIIGSGAADFDTDEAVAEFCRALRRYEGVHDFHNFTRSRSYFYKMQAKRKQWKVENLRNAAEAQASDDDVLEAEDAADDDDAEEDSTIDDYSEESSQFEDEEGLTRKLLTRHRRSIYSCSGSLIPDFCGEPHLRVHIVGQAFLLNQIRCMVGGALAVATKGMSRVAFDAALTTNRIVRVPIAPAEGLVLLSSSFGGKLHTVSLYEDPNTTLAKERKDLVHRVLLNRREDEEMKKFREEVIYKEVVSSWDMEEKMDRWRAYLGRCYESNQRLDEDELAAVLYELDQAKLASKNRNQSYVEQNRLDLAEKGRQGALLPKQFATKLCVRYNVAPGIFTSDLRRAVTRHLKSGKIPLNADEEQIMVYIDNYGAEALAKEGRKLRLSIRT
ncbi:tRNA pseudouridine(38-40) synthase [Phytophthora cinnamomi]|uniref:tRNA pseudouridine(38-40) synthase n=1 Tax=Phytophthora cinnamomi TaxID=4785 RepID=UPI00355976B0|nr:tRNA pseudouridine(38-40) synthase [Phytophthora cinnamomi]